LAGEEESYRDCDDVHRLPEIFHYWSNRYIEPKLQKFGFNSPEGMIYKYILDYCHGRDCVRIVSIGSGNCEIEVELARHLRAAECPQFTIDCLDLNPAMLERGRKAAQCANVTNHLNFVQADLNGWTPSYSYDAAFANQSLHHVLHLESLFDGLRSALHADSPFVISDMIGRNGHQRWPEALPIVQKFWTRLPPSYRFNNKLNRYEELFENWDYSSDSFEGIRAQDILPLLRKFFAFELFIAFGNVVDPFVDSAFGDNFDASSDWDTDLIDEIHARDEQELLAGRIKPTHMMAVVRPQWSDSTRYLHPFDPAFCERCTAVSDGDGVIDLGSLQSAYDWQSSPHSPQRELEIACLRLKQLSARLRDQETLVQERTAWAHRLNSEVAERDLCVYQLQEELQERTRWATRLDAELVRLRRDLGDLKWARPIDRRFHNFLDACFRMVRRVRDRMTGKL
jgi:SAM-dependent methyltransferase